MKRDRVKEWDAWRPWIFMLFYCGRKEELITIEHCHQTWKKGRATSVHVGYVEEERGEIRHVAMFDKTKSDAQFIALNATKFIKPLVGYHLEYIEMRLIQYLMALNLHKLTGAHRFEAWTISGLNGGKETAVYVLSERIK